MPRRSRTKEKRLSVGINISLLLIITIFGIFLALPFRMLFDANLSEQSRDRNNATAAGAEKERVLAIPMDHRRLKRCPNLQYEDHLMSVFLSDYDENCTYERDDDDEDDGDDDDDNSDNDSGSEEKGDSGKNEEETGRPSKRGIDAEMKGNAEEILKTRQMKSVTVAGHILVTMLLVSAVAALVEVLRIRFARDKRSTDKSFAIILAELIKTVSRCSNRHAFVKLLHLFFSKMHKDSSRASTIISRRCSSSVDIHIPATKRHNAISRELIRSQKSFEIPGMHRSALRLLGARPPPLIRRSSFPTSQAKQTATSSVCGTPNTRLMRRPSIESDEDIVTNALHHRTRLIRRH